MAFVETLVKMNSLKFVIRRFSTLPGSFQKTAKILSYFEKCHRYEIRPETAHLRTKIVADLKASVPAVKLDVLLCSRIKDLNRDELLSIVNAWGSVRPDTLPSTVFYKTFVHVVRKGLWKMASWNHLVQIVHFVGYMNGEQDSKSLMILFLHSVDESMALPHAPYKDVCIICEAAFRTSTCISSPRIRDRITQILETLTDKVTNDSVWLVMLIKIMVLSNFYDVALLEKLSAIWISSRRAERMSFTTQCYVMSLFGHAAVKHDQLFQTFIESTAYKIQNNPDALRVKDVSMFLWATSTLSFNMDTEFLNQIILPYLLRQLNDRNLREGLGIIIQCAIAYWMLGPLPKPLFDKIITMDVFATLKGKEKDKNPRDFSRFALLTNILEAECGSALSLEQEAVRAALSSVRLLVPSLKNEAKERPELRNLVASLCTAGFSHVQLEYIVLVYVAGVTARIGDRTVHIDLLDPTVCLASSLQPIGRLRAKVRLLKLHYPYVKHAYVTSEDVNKSWKKEEWVKILGL